MHTRIDSVPFCSLTIIKVLVSRRRYTQRLISVPFCSLCLEFQQARERANVAVVAVQPLHHDEPALVQHVPLEALVLFRNLLKKIKYIT